MVNVAGNRRARKWSRREQVARVLWALAAPLFRWSPRPLWGWRRATLRAFGATVGAEAHIYPTVRITMPWNLRIGDGAAVGDHAILYALGLIRIGARTTVSQYAHLCAGSHDWRDPAMPLLKPAITIEEDAWICADAFIGPGVCVGAYAVVGARAVLMRDCPRAAIMVGNPAVQSGTRDGRHRHSDETAATLPATCAYTDVCATSLVGRPDTTGQGPVGEQGRWK